MKKKLAIIATAIAAFALSGCYSGNPDNPSQNFAALKRWNNFNNSWEMADSAEANKWINAILGTIPCCIVYGLCAAGDILIFNTMGFWTGDNPMAMTEIDGVEYQLAKTSDTTATLTNTQTGESVQVSYDAQTQACKVAL